MVPPRHSLPLRPEIQRLMIMSEYVLASLNEKPLTEEERHAIELYREELAKALDADLIHNEPDQTLSLFRL